MGHNQLNNNEKESSTHLIRKHIIKELANRTMEEIKILSKQINFNNNLITI